MCDFSESSSELDDSFTDKDFVVTDKMLQETDDETDEEFNQKILSRYGGKTKVRVYKFIKSDFH